MRSFRARPEVVVLSDHAEVPGLGFLPVNAFGVSCPTATFCMVVDRQGYTIKGS
jgi:hypothetical protein